MIVENGEIENDSGMRQRHEMRAEPVEMLEDNGVSSDKPVGHHKSQKRSQEGAKGKSKDVCAQDDPQKWYKIEHVHKGNAGQ